MRIKETGRAFGGAVIVYLTIAACGASDGTNGGGGPGSSSSSSSGASGSASGGALDAALDALVDAFVDPVKDANAGPVPPVVFTENCDKTVQYGSGTNTSAAVHDFPGKLVNDLAQLHIVQHSSLPVYQARSGGALYDNYMGAHSIYLRDGSVIVLCPAGDTVTFILQQ